MQYDCKFPGFDFKKDFEFFWIAEQALQSVLPPNWSEISMPTETKSEGKNTLVSSVVFTSSPLASSLVITSSPLVSSVIFTSSPLVSSVVFKAQDLVYSFTIQKPKSQFGTTLTTS